MRLGFLVTLVITLQDLMARMPQISRGRVAKKERRKGWREGERPWTLMESFLSPASATNQGRTVTWRQVIEVSEGPEQQQWGGLPGGSRPGP